MEDRADDMACVRANRRRRMFLGAGGLGAFPDWSSEMKPVFFAIVLAIALLSPSIHEGFKAGSFWRIDSAFAQSDSDVSAKEAFEASKALDTVEAWMRFS